MKAKDLISPFFLLGVKDFAVSRELKQVLKEYLVGGLVLFNSPHDSPLSIWQDPQTALEIIYAFMKEIDAGLISVDQEGGRVRRLRAPFVEIPSAAFMGRVFREMGPEPVKKIYEWAAEQMALTKINLNFAPVCDLAYADAHSTVMGDRCFSSQASEVVALAKIFCEAFSSWGIHCVLKHYPGHGPSHFDSHEQAALLFKSKQEMDREDTRVFQEVSAKAIGIMTAHIAFEENPDRIFSLDPEWISEARDQWPSKTLWFTDDLLTMKAVSSLKPWLRCLDIRYDYLLLCDVLDRSLPALEESIRWHEARHLPFAEELEMEKRIQAHQKIFLSSRSLQPFSQWKRRILEISQQSQETIQTLKQKLS